jgi:putative FmdB family regulatory protein
MPLYDFYCDACDRDFEVTCPIVRRPYVVCPYGYTHKVKQVIKLGHGGIQLFEPDTWRDIAFNPIRVETPQQLRKELENRGKQAEYLENGPWKTSPEKTLEEFEGERKHRGA